MLLRIPGLEACVDWMKAGSVFFEWILDDNLCHCSFVGEVSGKVVPCTVLLWLGVVGMYRSYSLEIHL